MTAAEGSRERALTYKHDDLIAAFSQRYGVPLTYSEELFEELKKWLWLSAKSVLSSGPELQIFRTMGAVDEMWHAFILYTEDYAAYCRNYLGRFVHHYPTPIAVKSDFERRLQENPQSARQLLNDQLAPMLQYVEGEFGPQTLIKWFGEEERLSFKALATERARLLGDENVFLQP